MRKRRLIASLALAVAALSIGTTAHAAPAKSGTRHCGVLLAKVRPGETSSKVLKEACSSSQAGMAKALGVQEDVILLSLFKDADFQGDAKNWLGADGPCDSAGYAIPNLHTTLPWNSFDDSISSWYQGTAFCNYVNFWSDPYYSGKHVAWPHYTSVSYVGDYINDQTSSISVHYEP